MQIILLERVEKLGFMGDVVEVRPGFARNYLLPQKKALRASKENLEFFKVQKTHLEADNLKHKKDAEKVAEKIEGINLTVIRQAGDSGQLYGSVTPKDVADLMAAAGFKVQKMQVEVSSPIKTLGLHDFIVRLHPEVKVKVVVNVAKTEEEAAAQLRGEDIRVKKEAAESEAFGEGAESDLSEEFFEEEFASAEVGED
jgi:large subunit ribosomal protein L9